MTARILGTCCLFLVTGPVLGAAEPEWLVQRSGTSARLRGLAVVDAQGAWATGAAGTVLRTTDGGQNWRSLAIPGSDGLDFRDVHAFDDASACVLAIGAGELSRIYRTNDGGQSWQLAHQNRDPRIFLDAIAFWDAEHGLCLGDPVDGRFTMLATDDGGRTWTAIPPDGMPPALEGEGAFAASGTCLTVGGNGLAWFGTGGAKASRILRSTDRGRTWSAVETPIRAGNPSSGIFSVAFADATHGVAVGGDYLKPDETGPALALTADGGQSWTLPETNGLSGFRSAVSVVPGTSGRAWIAVGPTGADRSVDGGRTWRRLGRLGFHALEIRGSAGGWAVGEDGRIAALVGLNEDGH